MKNDTDDLDDFMVGTTTRRQWAQLCSGIAPSLGSSEKDGCEVRVSGLWLRFLTPSLCFFLTFDYTQTKDVFFTKITQNVFLQYSDSFVCLLSKVVHL